ncbi:MAG: hypothetical protein ACR2PK_08780, partial [Acidimicrobiales bacterium]
VAFPGEFASMLPVLKREWSIDDLYLTRVLSGKSGARVIVVDIDCRDFSGQAILKLEIPEDDVKDDQVEPELHRKAIANAAEYAEAHIPRLVHTLKDKEQTASLLTIAAGGLEYCSVWFHLTFDDQVETARRVSNDVLESWNSGYQLVPGMIEAPALFENWLGERLEPGVSRMDVLLTETFNVDPHEQTLLHDGDWYPNPVVFARGESPSGPPIRAVAGNTHGDLHGHNLLTRVRRSDVSDYFLIDLAFYEEDGFLFFDQAYLELSYLLRARADVDPGRWLEVLQAAFEGPATSAEDVGVMRVVEAIRQGQQTWVADHEENRTSYMESQMILARVAAGLRFANMRVPVPTKIKGLLYAATALKGYLELHELPWPRSGAVVDFAQ